MPRHARGRNVIIGRDVGTGLVAEGAEPGHPAPARHQDQSAGRGFQLSRGAEGAGHRGAEAGREGADDGFAGLVAGGLGPLRRPDDPHGLALGGHLPHRRWPRRRRHGQPALRADQLLAGQRQPRQGAAPALADQAQVRQQDLVGRPDHPRRHAGLRVDGPEDLRLRLRPRGHLASGEGHLVGRREAMAGAHRQRGQPLLRRARPGEPAGRRDDGPDLREPGRRGRQARPAQDRPRRARHLRPHGDERRGNRGADRRRPHGRQGARQRQRRQPRPAPGRRRSSRSRAWAGTTTRAAASVATP